MTRRRWSAWAPDGRTVVTWPDGSGLVPEADDDVPEPWSEERRKLQREVAQRSAATKRERAKRKRADRAVIAGLAAIIVAQWAAFLRWHGGGL